MCIEMDLYAFLWCCCNYMGSRFGSLIFYRPIISSSLLHMQNFEARGISYQPARIFTWSQQHTISQMTTP